MAKRHDQIKFSQQSVEHHTFHDDSIIPPSEELAKLAKIDPSFIPWMQRFVSTEQAERAKARAEFVAIENRKIDTLQQNDRRNFWQDVLVLIGSIGLVMFSLQKTYELILEEKYVSGVLVGGATLAIVVRTIQRSNKSPVGTKRK